MASASSSRVDEQPPALPVKQHRHSSVESDSSPVVPQHQSSAYNDVFPEPTDCNAAQCPIHQRYDPCRHLERFYSDINPPPVPKKKLHRALSLPPTHVPSLPPKSPLSPLQRFPQNFDNPLYMMAPKQDLFFSEELEEFKPSTSSPVSVMSFSQLSFDTPDKDLPYIFHSFVDQGVVSHGIQHRHLLFLRSMAQTVEARNLLEGSKRDVSSYQPQDFLLHEGSQPKQIGNMTYYSLHSPMFPQRVLGLRVHKHTDEVFSAHIQRQPPHVNVRDVITYFPSSNSYRTSETRDPAAGSPNPRSECNPANPPGGSSTERAAEATNLSKLTVQSFLQKGQAVSVERDVPHASLDDFVKDSSSLQSTDSVRYYRQVCALLLQILMGTHHLYSKRGTAAELKPQEILLVWPNRKRDKAEHNLNEDGSEEKEETEWENTPEKGRIQTLWRTKGCPRVVLKPQTFSQPLTSIKSQITALIQACCQESATSPGSDVCKSSYQKGLLHLSSLLESDSGTQMMDMVAMLQVLLWGPHVSIFNQGGPATTVIHNWLTVKRALLVMKLAESGLIEDRSLLDWEECMCLQYLSFTDSETVASVANELWNRVNAEQSL
ncbi:inactive tyrosine-protein kinase PEAK1 [Oreochromis niloticus]|uniref:inactive tyrosine-protein kinase PEAK1 n=1 Tax=Oreochromis niloticus TaxID=8128 RepID=UPI0003941FF7|nr:inactive tyrosine-protein kinase PEAK1 [Oreochromis niloticus]CAI5639242.1 unnamed protein product [Mustela putorius furo]